VRDGRLATGARLLETVWMLTIHLTIRSGCARADWT